MVFADIFEPPEIADKVIAQVGGSRIPLNERGYADYFWTGVGHIGHQVENKAWSEILAGLDHVESQLAKQLPNVDCNYLLIRGVISPTKHGIDIYQQSWTKPYFHVKYKHGKSGQPQEWLYKRVMAWLWQLDKAGVTVVWVPNDEAAVTTLVAMYEQSQKMEHRTLRRYIKKKVQTVEDNPHVQTLMGIVGAGIGEARAKVLIARYGTVWSVLNAGPSELGDLPGIGPGVVSNLWRAIGHNVSPPDNSKSSSTLDNILTGTDSNEESGEPDASE